LSRTDRHRRKRDDDKGNEPECVDHLRLFGHMSQRRKGAAREGKGSRKSHVRILLTHERAETEHVPDRTIEAANWSAESRTIELDFQAPPIGRQHRRYRRAEY
jgi:hypothetical protein